MQTQPNVSQAIVNISPAIVSQAIKEVQQSIKGKGFDLNPEQLAFMAMQYKEIILETIQWGIRDTEVQTLIANSLAKAFTSFQHWPTYGDGKAGWNVFCQELQAVSQSGLVKVNLDLFKEII